LKGKGIINLLLLSDLDQSKEKVKERGFQPPRRNPEIK